MIRKITNKIKGRKRLKKEDIAIDQVVTLLEELDSETKINFSYTSECNWTNCTLSSNQERVLDYFKKRFLDEKPNHSTTADYQVYAGKNEEVHYINITTVKVVNQGNKIKQSEFADASLSYVIKKAA